MAFPIARTITLWRERWTMPEDMVRQLSRQLRKEGAVIVSGGDYDRWDFSVRAGVLGGAQLLMTVEEHGAGKQLFRFMVWPKYSWEGIAIVVVLGALAGGAIFDRAVTAYLIFTALTAVFAFRLLQEGSVALAAVERALSEPMDSDFEENK